jgi:chaperonin GroES
MAKIKIRPLDDRVVVEPMAAEEVTAGGIVLPDNAKEKPQRGTVVAVGPGKLLDEVIFGKYGGTEIEVDGEEVKILRESDILAKVV